MSEATGEADKAALNLTGNSAQGQADGTTKITQAPVQAGVSTEANAGERPDWYPEGVNTVEELEAWHRKQFNDPKSGEAVTEKTPEELAAEAKALEEAKPEELSDDQIRENLQKAGGIYADPRYEPFAIEVERTGAISDASVAAAAAAFNVPENAVRDFVAGQLAARELAATKGSVEATTQTQAVANALVAAGFDASGYDAFVKWGAEALPEATRTAFDKALDANDVGTINALLPGMKALYDSAHPSERREITQQGAADRANANAPAAAKPFGSVQEQTAAMMDPRYDNDPGYRASVDARVVVSNYNH